MSLKKPVEKADLFRYLSTYFYGGFYSDIDSSCVRPIENIYNKFKTKNFICGLESYPLNEQQRIRHQFTHTQQICNWSFACKKNHPLMKDVIDEVIKRIRDGKISDTLFLTGPGPFTYAIYNNISKYDDAVILPCCYFSSNFSGYRRRPEERNNEYVKHHYKGSWK